MVVNTNLNHGPLAWNIDNIPQQGNGRGIYRSRVPNQHDRGTFVYFGEQFSILRTVPDWAASRIRSFGNGMAKMQNIANAPYR